MNRSMTLEEFDLALQRYGGDLERWPPGARDHAVRLLAASSEAAAALREARAFEQYLRSNDPGADIDVERCAEISRRVLASTRVAVDGQARGRASRWRILPRLTPVRLPAVRFAASALTAAVLGLLAGQGLTQFGSDSRVDGLVVDAGSTGTDSGLAGLFRQPHLMTAELR